MAAMNRLFSLYSESSIALQHKCYEQGYDFMRSFKDRHKRDNCVIGIGISPGL